MAQDMWNDLAAPKVPLTRTGKVAWLMSFIDLLSIILCAFVMMFAMKAVNLKRWDTVSGSFRQTFSPVDLGRTGPAMVVPDNKLNGRDDLRAPLTDGLRYMDSVLRRKLEGDPRWGRLQGRFIRAAEGQSQSGGGRLLYALGTGRDATVADWQRLAGALRVWDNTMQLVVTGPVAVSGTDLSEPTKTAVQVYTLLRASGVGTLDAIEWRPGAEFGVSSGMSLQIRGS